jgi:ribosomal protein L7/L12
MVDILARVDARGRPAQARKPHLEAKTVLASAAMNSAPTSKNPVQITREQVAARAYERFLERGGEHGHDLEDWLAAEAELRQGSRTYDVVLVDPGKGVIEVVRRIRELTGMALPEIQSLMAAAPRTLKRVPSLREAEQMRDALQTVGARVQLRPVN